MVNKPNRFRAPSDTFQELEALLAKRIVYGRGMGPCCSVTS